MSVMILDAGNSIIKAKIARREQGEVTFPHALKQLTETEFRGILARAGKTSLSLDYSRINGLPYAVGESAERHGVHIQRTGAARYTRDYYGIFAAAALARLYERGGEIMVFGSHPPGDVNFRQHLMKAVIGDWQVETNGSEKRFRVTYANTFDEPVGGLMNVLLAEDGQHYQRSDLNAGRSLVIDIGGFTTDSIAVNPGGEVDYSLSLMTVHSHTLPSTSWSRSSGVVQESKRPSRMKAMRIATASESEMMWVESRLRKRTRSSGSRPTVGSSTMSTCGSLSRAWAMPTRCFIPPEYPPSGRRAASRRLTSSSSPSIRSRAGARSSPLAAARYSRNSMAFKFGYTPKSWGR